MRLEQAHGTNNGYGVSKIVLTSLQLVAILGWRFYVVLRPLV